MTPYASPPKLSAPPLDLTRACERPQRLPKGDMKQLQVEAYWGKDRRNLVACAKRHGLVVDYYRNRDAALAPPKG